MKSAHRSFLAPLVLAAFTAIAGGCADLVDHDYRLRYPIGVEQRTAILDVSSIEEDQDRIAAFAADFLKPGNDGKVFVTINGNTADDAEAITMAQDIGATLRGLGLGADEIELRLVVAPAAQRRAVLTYAFYVTRPPECGNYTRDISTNMDNAPTDNFGCSIQHNLGLMISNPRDLLRPQAGGEGRYGSRSADVVGKYQRGAPIAAPKEVSVSKTGK